MCNYTSCRDLNQCLICSKNLSFILTINKNTRYMICCSRSYYTNSSRYLKLIYCWRSTWICSKYSCSIFSPCSRICLSLFFLFFSISRKSLTICYFSSRHSLENHLTKIYLTSKFTYLITFFIYIE